MTATATIDAAPTSKVAAALLNFVLDTDRSTAVPKAYTYNQNGDRYSFQSNR